MSALRSWQDLGIIGTCSFINGSQIRNHYRPTVVPIAQIPACIDTLENQHPRSPLLGRSNYLLTKTNRTRG